MAAAEVVRWSSVVGEYGVLLTEMGSMEDLHSPIKPYPRIKYTCMTASKKYVALGSSTGGLYVIDRKTRKHVRFISNKDGPILAVCFAQCRSLLGVATSPGIVLVWEVSSRHREKPKFIRRSEEHKNTTVTALCWDEEETRLFIGDVKGVVSVVHIPQAGKSPVNKGFPLLHTTAIVAKAHTSIVQLDCVGDKLLVSTMTKCAIVDLKSLNCVPVGVKLRDGLYGSCFFKEGVSDTPTIYAARPGSRLWEASIDGQVMATQQYKKLLGTAPVPLLGYGHSATEAVTEEDFPPQSVNFAKLLLVRDQFIVTWHGTSVYIMDPVLGQLVAWYAMEKVVEDVVCIGEEFYVYDAEGCVKWFALLSVKECVSRLFEMGEINQCLQVLLSCKHYIIPGSARDLVSVSLVAKLREDLSEEGNEDKEDIINELQELERDMEPATEASDGPPSNHGNTSLTDSPDTLSLCSDAFTDDLELNVPSGGRTSETGEDDVKMAAIHSDEGSMSKSGLHRKVKKQWSTDITLEGILMSAAAAAKKFTAERQKGLNKLKRSQSADSPGGGRPLSSPRPDSSPDSPSEIAGDADTGAYAEGLDIHETIQEEETPLLQKKAHEQSPCHSDDSESRQSGNEERGVVEDEASDKREKLSLPEKKKRKKRVVTVDIDSPQKLKQEGTPAPHGRSSSFRATYSSTGDTEVRNRGLSEPVSPIQSELPPAIPAMLSKAKGLLKKKLKPSSGDLSPLLSPSPPAEEQTVGKAEEESQMIKCPQEVEELMECSAKTRNEVKNPLVLFSISSLRQAFEEWIPKLHGAMKSCLELNRDNDEINSKIDLTYFLDEPSFADVSYLTQMCFDCGVYGLKGMESLLDVSCDAISSEKNSSRTSLVVEDNTEMIDVAQSKDDVSSIVEPKTSKTIKEDEAHECDSSSLVEDFEATDESTQAGYSASHIDEPIPPSISTNAMEESCQGSALKSDSGDVVEINCDIVEQLEVSPDDTNRTQHKSSDVSATSLEEKSSNASSAARKSQAIFYSVPNCEPMCGLCENGTAFCGKDNESSVEQENDSIRSKFLAYYFFLLDVKQLRRTLFMSRGDRRKTWDTFVECLSGLVTADDVITRYLKEGDARRALHELHDGMDAYSDILLYLLTRLYEHSSRETMITCARMYPDVQPWEVMEICRQSSALSLESGSADFVFYVEQLMRWRAEVGNTKEHTIAKICEDIEIAKWWFHCSLIVDSSTEGLHCQHCGKPRPGSHTLQWQKADHLQHLIDFLCQRNSVEYKDFMDLCWKHGYWSGLIRLCIKTNQRQEALELVVSLSDLKLIKDSQPWGLLPKSLDEWRHLLDLLLSRDHHGKDSRHSPHSCTPLAAPDWLPDLTWSNVINLMLERLGAGHTVNLLQALPRDMPLLTTDFYYSCLLGAVIERRQRTLIHELLKKLDSYLWSQRSGCLTPKLNNFRKEEETSGPTSKEDFKPQLESMLQFRTLEDGASNWGQNIRLSDGECLVCSLKLCEQISTSNQGLLLFECGHVFHKHCVPEAACVLCFHQNLTTLGTKVL